jgi:8-oxo-dGTP pyrophosphatase MutT (NUDIX family)
MSKGEMMAKSNGPWKVEESTCTYKGEFIEVYEDRVINPEGKPDTYATVTTPPGAAVLPIDDQGIIYLARQFRYAIGKESMEAASGAIEDGEADEEAAKRELREELGIAAKEFVDLGIVNSNTSLMREKSHLFLAFSLTFKEPEREGSEQMRTVSMPLDEAVRLVMTNEIFSTVTCTLILKAKEYMKDESRTCVEVVRSPEAPL